MMEMNGSPKSIKLGVDMKNHIKAFLATIGSILLGFTILVLVILAFKYIFGLAMFGVLAFSLYTLYNLWYNHFEYRKNK